MSAGETSQVLGDISEISPMDSFLEIMNQYQIHGVKRFTIRISTNRGEFIRMLEENRNVLKYEGTTPIKLIMK